MRVKAPFRVETDVIPGCTSKGILVQWLCALKGTRYVPQTLLRVVAR
jgi:hypothetical protein